MRLQLCIGYIGRYTKKIGRRLEARVSRRDIAHANTDRLIRQIVDQPRSSSIEDIVLEIAWAEPLRARVVKCAFAFQDVRPDANRAIEIDRGSFGAGAAVSALGHIAGREMHVEIGAHISWLLKRCAVFFSGLLEIDGAGWPLIDCRKSLEVEVEGVVAHSNAPIFKRHYGEVTRLVA